MIIATINKRTGDIELVHGIMSDDEFIPEPKASNMGASGYFPMEITMSHHNYKRLLFHLKIAQASGLRRLWLRIQHRMFEWSFRWTERRRAKKNQ